MITLSRVHWLHHIAKGVCDMRRVKKPGSEPVNKKIFHCGGSEIALFFFFLNCKVSYLGYEGKNNLSNWSFFLLIKIQE